MRIEDVFSELNKIEKLYRDLILTTNYLKKGSEISWTSYKPGIEKRLYAREYEMLVQNRQYSFLLSDDMGFVQFYFKFDSDEITKAKMAYYPYPVKLQEDIDDVEDYHDSTGDLILEEYYFDIWNLISSELAIPLKDRDISEEFSRFMQEVGLPIDESQIVSYNFERKYEITNTSHLRVDFDCSVTSHHQCEIQVGALNQIRLPIQKLISPLLFFDFVVRNIYRENHQEISSKSHFSTDFINSARKSLEIPDFNENNIFVTHNFL